MYLERYKDLGFATCTLCLKNFNDQERVKRFPRECDHLFHIKCLEVLKILKITETTVITDGSVLSPFTLNSLKGLLKINKDAFLPLLPRSTIDQAKFELSDTAVNAIGYLEDLL